MIWIAVVTHLRLVGISNPRIFQGGAVLGILVLGFNWFGYNSMEWELQSFGSGQNTFIPFLLVFLVTGGMFLSGVIFTLVRRIKGSKNLS